MAQDSGTDLVPTEEIDDAALGQFVEGVHAELENKRRRVSPEEQAAQVMGHLLRQLGKTRVQEDELTFEGSKFIFPSQYKGNVPGVIEFLMRHEQNQKKVHTISRTYKFRPYDGANAFLEVMRTLTGTRGLGVSTFTFFGEQKPKYVSVNVDVNKTIQVPWGKVEFPQFQATFTLAASEDEDYGVVFQLSADAPKKRQQEIEGVFMLVEDELRKNSLYRGKAVSGDNWNPEFLDLSVVDEDRVVYSDKVLTQLHANVWAPVEFTAAYREQGVSIKRAVLFAGPYGTGKTLGCMLTAQRAVANGWTFIQCRTGRDNPAEVMKTAALYAPAVVVVEDFDSTNGTTTAIEISQLLEMLDGVTSKGKEVIGLFTTNHMDRIQKGALRPGRIDAIIEIDGLDEPAFKKLITVTLGNRWLEKKIEWTKVAEAMDGFQPAYVKEAAERAQRYAMARRGGKPSVISTDDLINAADSLRPQLELMTGAKEGLGVVTIDDVLRRNVESVVTRTKMVDYGEPFQVETATLLNGGKQQ